jgi:hypothetical protein
VGIGFVATATEIGNVGVVEPVALLGECHLAEVAGVVVGDGEGGEVLLQERNTARVGAEIVRLPNAVTFYGDDAFEVADGDVGTFQQA